MIASLYVRCIPFTNSAAVRFEHEIDARNLVDTAAIVLSIGVILPWIRPCCPLMVPRVFDAQMRLS